MPFRKKGLENVKGRGGDGFDVGGRYGDGRKKNVFLDSLKMIGVWFGLGAWGSFGVTIIQFLVYWIFSFLSADFQVSWVMALYDAVMYVVAFLIVAFVPGILIRKWRTRREELGLTGAPTWKDIGLAMAGFVIYFVCSGVLTSVFRNMFEWFNVNEAQDVGFNNVMGAPDLLVAFVALVIVAPVAEELIFRGWIYGKMRKVVNAPVAILLVSVLFGVMHGQWNVAVDVFMMSVILCFMRELTGTV